MTTADTIEINNLLGDAASMLKFANTTKTPYHDEKIADFARRAIDNHKEVKKYIIEQINKNIAIFFNLKNLRVDNCGLLGYSWREDKNIMFKLGYFFNIVFKLHPKTKHEFWRGNAGGLYTMATSDEIEIVDVFASTSDTSIPEYKISSAWSLTDPNAEKCGRVFYLNGVYSVDTWNKIYDYAAWSNAQTDFLLRSFKEAVAARIKVFKRIGDENEQLFKKNEENKSKIVIDKCVRLFDEFLSSCKED